MGAGANGQPSPGEPPNGQLPAGAFDEDQDELESADAADDQDDDGDAAGEELGDLPESLEEALLDAASDMPGLTVRTTDDRHEFVAAGRVVATLGGAVAEFRLDPAVTAAALRTPGTRRSTAAPDRIAFQPSELDLYALDRAVAWLRSAARLAR
jgi:hypothetical protein